MHRSSFRPLHIEVRFAILSFILLFPFFLEFDTARANHKPVECKHQNTDEENTAYDSSGNGTDIGARVM